LTKKFVEKSTQLDAAKQYCAQLEQNVAALQDQINSLKSQLEAVLVNINKFLLLKITS
jgi:phage shock protein A